MPKRFSQYKKGGGQYKACLRKVRQHLDQVSSGEPEVLLEAFLASRKQGKLFKNIINSFSDKKLDKIINSIRHIHTSEEDYKKRRWISILSPIFTRDQLRQKGFVVSKRAFASANSHARENFPGAAITEKRGRPVKKTTDFIASVTSFAKSHSYPAANRTVKINHEVVPVRFLNHGYKLLYALFLQRHNGKISYTTFRDTIPKYFKKPRKDTDMCGICVHGKKSVIKLNRFREQIHRDCIDCSRDSKCDAEQNSQQFADIQVLVERVGLYNQHYNFKTKQRASFKQQVASLQAGSAALVIDFKANIKLNIESPQISKSFFNQPQRTLFGASLAYYCAVDKCVKKFHFDIFSKCLAHNAFFVQTALKSIFADQFFKKLDIKQLYLWMDNAGHFKNKELHRYFSDCISEYKFNEIHVNYFAEYHGKSWCDSRFSLITRLMKQATDIEGVSVRSTRDYIEILSNELDRIAAKSEDKAICSTQFIVDIDEQLPELQPILGCYNNIKSYLSFIFKANSIQRKYTTDAHVVDIVQVKYSHRVRKSVVAKQGHASVVVSEDDIGQFFVQLKKRAQFMASQSKVAKPHGPETVNKSDTTSEDNEISRTTVDLNPLDPCDSVSFEDTNTDPTAEVSTPISSTATQSHYLTRASIGISKKRKYNNDDINSPVIKRRKVTACHREESSQLPSMVVDILQQEPSTLIISSKKSQASNKLTKSKRSSKKVIQKRTAKLKETCVSTMDIEFQELIDSSQPTCDLMDIEGWGGADDVAFVVQNGRHIICE